MNFTAYHAKYFAYELTRQRASNDLGKLTSSLQDAQVDLNPHQVEAALFAFQSPLSHGAILADEVGLGKTIEAGIILSQQWAERKRKLLIIAPSNLRKQWNQELADKFFLPSIILETKSFNEYVKGGNLNPFNQNDNIVICSYHFAKNKAVYVEQTNWDLVIIDEAHRLRNVYKASNKIGNVIKASLEKRKKVLLTATPLQNSILELYGLVSIIDDFIFGDLKSFKSQYSRQLDEGNYDELKSRLLPICHRTLRRQVLEYINYTERRAVCEEFIPTDQEHQLYEWVSEYLQRPKLYALPNSQRQLMTLILRKLLASSSYAIFGTLDALVKKLEKIVVSNDVDLFTELEDDFETLDEISDEWVEEEAEEVVKIEYTDEDIEAINDEIQDLKQYRDLANRIRKNSKAERLITALDKAFQEIEKIGANKKALIFTESRRTQEFIYNLLEARGYKDKIVQFNGSNTDVKSKEIYKAWLEEHKGTDKVTGSPTADKRAALVDYFKEEATLMIATEAAAEGINLQFCSLIVNFDLPWNPQRIEQRIGRCHRYGQKHDVVVVNFLNVKNAADQRVYELLDQKFRLFDGVFGSSDEVLGSIGNGVDFEKRIAQIYNDCRTIEEIKTAFDNLQAELKPEISEKIQAVRTTLLEHFDEEVKEKLKSNLLETKQYLNTFEDKLWKTTQYFLNDYAEFSEDYSFKLLKNPFPTDNIHSGPYMILRPKEGQKKSDIHIPDDTNIFRIGHKLAQRILTACKTNNTPNKEVIFNYTETPTKVTTLEKYIGQSGWLQLQHLEINSFELEDYILMACYTENGETIESEIAQRLFSLNAFEKNSIEVDNEVANNFKELIYRERQSIISENANRNRDFFDVEMDKLDQWADDMKISLEKEIRDLDAEIRLRKSEAKKMLNLEAKVKSQRQIKELEKKRSEKRQTLFSAQDNIDDKKENLLSDIERRLNQKINQKELFTIKWKMI
ncbi:SNF2-related protein [uncultured Flavobacterium sp.]|uniref:SNF2-related protein n=1 Tax=uncultured Flavobacterium sp. TaxID=165435 RepID=UPI0030EDE354|tara:strand:- start:69090 stop:71984 length:2895 start_codon:yes stop_codon:yes gene_type:complete